MPQLIGVFDNPATTVNIQVWNITDGNNAQVPISSSGCYEIGDTSRWGWSTANMPVAVGNAKHYFYNMVADTGENFEGQFILDIPERSKWIHPSDDSGYITKGV